ncbi:hypothetical protein [Haloactinospora alba]|nr:hypothetical protein [Haloactinospora alba]
MANVYEHVTPAMKEQMRSALEARWRQSLQALKPAECQWILETALRLGEYYRAPCAWKSPWWQRSRIASTAIVPKKEKATEAASALRCCWWAILDSNQ